MYQLIVQTSTERIVLGTFTGDDALTRARRAYMGILAALASSELVGHAYRLAIHNSAGAVQSADL